MEKETTSGIMQTVILIGLLTSAFNIHQVKASGTIYVRADGSIDPPTAPIHRDGDVYILTGNIIDSIVIERNNMILDGAGYTLQGTGAHSEGILLSGRSNVTVKNTKVTEFATGISLIGSSNNTISGNTITANDPFGIGLNSSSSNSISGNTITNNGYGIWLYFGSNNNVSGNIITANNWYGIGANEGKSNIISGNTITNMDEGITLYSGSNSSISGNNIANNGVGIVLTYCYFSYNISENTIAHNGEGIRSVFSSSNRIYRNDFIGNTKQVWCYSWTNIWDGGYPSGGNYWSDYTGADANRDGIGDTPYRINENNQDHYPLMSPLGRIPVEGVLPTPPFWMQWWFYAIVAAIMVTLAGAVYFLKKRKPPTPAAPPLPTESA